MANALTEFMMTQEPIRDEGWLFDIAHKNKDKNFVKRMMDPESSPMIINPDGSHSSLLISSADYGGKGYVFPLIVQDPETGNLKKFDDWREALSHAIKTGEHIQFDNPEDAEWFGTNYKKLWHGLPSSPDLIGIPDFIRNRNALRQF